MISLNILRSIEILAGLKDDELALVKRYCEEVAMEGDAVVFEEGDPADYLYVLLNGLVSIRYRLPHGTDAGDRSISLIGPGGTFGWSSLRPSTQYRFSAQCEGMDCAVVRFGRDRLLPFLDANPVIGYKVMKNLALLIGRRFIALQDDIARKSGQDSEGG